MSRVRILGPRERLPDTLRAIQDAGVLHLAQPPETARVEKAALTPKLERERRNLLRTLDDVHAALSRLGTVKGVVAGSADFAGWARLARRARRALEQIDQHAAALADERALIQKYEHLFQAFRPLLEAAIRWPNATAYHVLLKSSDENVVATLRATLRTAIGQEFELFTHPLPSGEIALVVVVSAEVAQQVERLLQEARVQEIPVPEAYGGGSLTEALPRMQERLASIPRELAEQDATRARLVRSAGPTLVRARQAIHDRLDELAAMETAGVSPHAFVIEGWVPAAEHEAFARALLTQAGPEIVVIEVAREEWTARDDAPVVLHNPRLFRPFETLVRLMPLPRYGSIDPTPFVAVFFPAFFGIMLGDIGYGVVLGAGALALRARAKPGTTLRALAEIAGACAVFTVIAGTLYGELFGDLGRQWFGLRPLAFDRSEALLPFLLLAIAIGTIHVLVGLGLGIVTARGHPRQVVGRGVSALMIVLIGLAVLAVANVLPHGFFTPAVIGILVAFPVLVVAEGVVGPIELLSTLGNILSYARIMALGVASVMLAVVANRMMGAVGSIAVGVLFGLLFHAVNFAIGLFSPTVHALRLHYVEFFGKFYSPGGLRYEPLRHWRPTEVRG